MQTLRAVLGPWLPDAATGRRHWQPMARSSDVDREVGALARTARILGGPRRLCARCHALESDSGRPPLERLGAVPAVHRAAAGVQRAVGGLRLRVRRVGALAGRPATDATPGDEPGARRERPARPTRFFGNCARPGTLTKRRWRISPGPARRSGPRHRIGRRKQRVSRGGLRGISGFLPRHARILVGHQRGISGPAARRPCGGQRGRGPRLRTMPAGTGCDTHGRSGSVLADGHAGRGGVDPR